LRGKYKSIIATIIICICASFAVINLKEDNAYANTVPILYSDAVEANVGQEISIPVKIKNNTGIMGFEIELKYNSDVFELKEVNKADILSGVFGTDMEVALNDTINIIWAGVSNISTDETLFYLNFYVKDDVSDNEIYQINMTSVKTDIFDEKYNDVLLEAQNITVNVSKSPGMVDTKPVPTDEPITASNEYVIYSNDLECMPGSNIMVPIYIRENKGVMGFVFSVKYDDNIMTPISVNKGKILSDNAIFDNNIRLTNGAFKVLWSGTEAINEDGELFNIVFNIKKEATLGITPIQLSCDNKDTFDESYDDLMLDIKDIQLNIVAGYNNEPIATESPDIKPDKTPIPTFVPNIPNNNINQITDKNAAISNPIDNIQPNQKQNEIMSLKKIKIKYVRSVKKKKITLKWKQTGDKKISGYEIQYSTSKKFKKAKLKKVPKNKTSLTITKLKSKKKYYVRIRSYNKYTSENGVTKKKHSNWSKVKSCKVK